MTIQTFEIKKWLLERRLTIREVARRAQVSPAYASLTIWGKRRSLKVLKTLRRLGCPVEFLGLKEKQAA